MRQKLGQHFLKNPEISRAIATALELKEKETVIEVGPGHGELTEEILSVIHKDHLNNTKIVAVEKDVLLAKETGQKYGGQSEVEIIPGDILEFLSAPDNQNLLKNKYKLAGNLPYYLTGHFLRIVGELRHKPELILLMIQKEVADRIIAKPPKMNRLAASVQFWAEPKILFYVSKNEFNPPPDIDSAVIILKPRRKERLAGETRKTDEIFYETVRELFSQPRKTILNNLRKTFDKHGLSTKEGSNFLEEMGIDSRLRPQDLDLQKIMDLADKFSDM